MILTLERLQAEASERNARCYPECDGWTPGDWGLALAGEVGELSNKLKKRKLGRPIPDCEVAEELADIVIYAAIMATSLGLDLAACVVDKFEARSLELGYPPVFKSETTSNK